MGIFVGGILLTYPGLLVKLLMLDGLSFTRQYKFLLTQKNGVTYWILGLQVLGIASLAAGFNFTYNNYKHESARYDFCKITCFYMDDCKVVNVSYCLSISSDNCCVNSDYQLDRLYGTHFFNPVMVETL